MKTIFIILFMTVLFSSCSNNQSTQAVYEGEDISRIATITRDKNTKSASLEINTTGKWTLYSGRTVETINFSSPLMEGEGSGTFALNVPDSVRVYFQLNTQRGKGVLAETHLPMAGGYNFRDLGGIRNKDGHYVKWGKIFRSDDLHSLTEADLQYLSSIPITTIVDFRSEQEINAAPDRVPQSTGRDYAYTITPGNLNAAATDISDLAGINMDSIMMSINTLLVTDSSSIRRYRDFFGLLQNENDIPLLFHCSAGKDRTGMGAALILYGLDVEDSLIMENYLASNKYLGDKYAEYMRMYPSLEALFQVKSQYLQAGIDQIRKDHGTVKDYLQNVLGVNIERFKEMYLFDYKR